MARIHVWYVGYDYTTLGIYANRKEQEIASRCGIWKAIDAETAQEAKDKFIELYSTEINDIAPYNDNE